MTLFGKDFIRSLVLGFALGSAAMAFNFGIEPAHATSLAAAVLGR